MEANSNSRSLINGVPADRIDEVWEVCAPIIEKAIKYGDGKMWLEDIHAALLNRDMQLWYAEECLWITEILNFPRSKRINIVLISGKLGDWEAWLDEIKDWARSLGCEALEATGRPGWGRKLKWPEIHRTYRIHL